MTDAPELLPCPFCGGKPQTNQYHAWCDSGECSVVVPITVWNQRTPPTITQQRFNEKMDALDAANPIPAAALLLRSHGYTVTPNAQADLINERLETHARWLKNLSGLANKLSDRIDALEADREARDAEQAAHQAKLRAMEIGALGRLLERFGVKIAQ